jgi:HK97 family phage major capsid protein
MGDENALLGYFQAEKKKHLDAVEEITKAATKEARGPNDEEREDIKRHMTAASELQGKIQSIVDNQALTEQVAKLGQTLETEPATVITQARSWGDAFTSSDVYAAIKGASGKWDSGAIEFRGAVGDPLLPQTGSNADALPETFVRQLETPGLRQEQPTLAALFMQVPVQDPTIRYPILTQRTRASGEVVQPGGAKPYGEYAFDDETVTLGKRAAFIAVAEEMLEDAPYIAAFINSDLPFMVQQNEDEAFATALYAAVTEVTDADTIGGDNAWDAIMAGVTAVRMNFFAEPDALFIHPLDWASTAISKAVAGTGGYFGAGPNAAPSQNLWGTPARVVISQRATLGLPIIGAFRLGGKVYRKGSIRVRASSSHEDFFRLNLVAILAETRSALGITYPEAFIEVDLGTS